jgi:ABC-2 type transport system ATP-binding protein
MSNIISIKNLTKRYGRTVALSDVTLDVPAGCVFALLGENGAGKSTTIKTLMGMIRPDSGTASVLGHDAYREQDTVRPRLGYIPEVPTLYDWMTIHEIGWFTAGFYPPGFAERFGKQIREFDLDLSQKIKNLSKGGRAKVSLALAMAHEPELLILDEPTSGLDTLVRRRFLESMVDVAATGRTVLLSSHQIGEVERVADHVAILHGGELKVCDSLENLKAVHERWIVTFNNHEPSLPEFGGRVILHEGVGSRRQQFLVQNPNPESLWQLRDHVGVNEVEVHVPSLEEIFVAYLKAPASPPAQSTNVPMEDRT